MNKILKIKLSIDQAITLWKRLRWSTGRNVDYVLQKDWCIVWGLGIKKIARIDLVFMHENRQHCTQEFMHGTHRQHCTQEFMYGTHMSWKSGPNMLAVCRHISNKIMKAFEEKSYSGDIFMKIFFHTEISLIGSLTSKFLFNFVVIQRSLLTNLEFWSKSIILGRKKCSSQLNHAVFWSILMSIISGHPCKTDMTSSWTIGVVGYKATVYRH